MAKKVAIYGMLIGTAFLFGYLESFIPIPIPIAGIKLGLANIITILVFYTMGKKDAFIIMIIRIVLSGLTFSGLSTMIYSLAGGILSYFIMYFLKTTNKFSIVGVSMAGGIFHNIGQIIIAALVLQSSNIFYYLPVLLISGCITGLLIGITAEAILKRIPKKISI